MENLLYNTLFVGKVRAYPEEIGSTNTYAMDWILTDKPPDGSVVITDVQKRGKGQWGNTWKSEPYQNITLSVILYPHFLPLSDQFLLNQAISLAICDLISSKVRPPVSIKWPNDIYWKDRKLGGILLENNISNRRIMTSIAGIGINVNQQEFDPALPNPVSIRQITGQYTELAPLIDELLVCLEKRYLQLKSGQYDRIKSDYLQALYRYQEYHRYKVGEQIITGQILGVNKAGKLVLESGGETLEFGSQEIAFLP